MACNIIKTVFLAVIIVPFIFSNVEGVNNYRKVNALDNKVTNQIISSVDAKIFEERKSISINYNVIQLIPYKNLTNYIESVIESDWAMAGKLQIARNDTRIGKIYINAMQEEADVSLYFDDEFNLVNMTKKGESYEQ